jgi:hypothetical protein
LIQVEARIRQALLIEPPATFAAVARAADQTATCHDTSRNRVLAPKAAKTAAETLDKATGMGLRIFRKMFLDHLHDHNPAAFVCAESCCATSQGDLVEAGLRDGQLEAVRGLLEGQNDERRSMRT